MTIRTLSITNLLTIINKGYREIFKKQKLVLQVQVNTEQKRVFIMVRKKEEQVSTQDSKYHLLREKGKLIRKLRKKVIYLDLDNTMQVYL